MTREIFAVHDFRKTLEFVLEKNLYSEKWNHSGYFIAFLLLKLAFSDLE